MSELDIVQTVTIVLYYTLYYFATFWQFWPKKLNQKCRTLLLDQIRGMSNVNFRAAYNSAKCWGFSKQNKSPLVGGVLQASKSYPNLGALLKASLTARKTRER